jgi:uncharacterized protein (DUF169 family)
MGVNAYPDGAQLEMTALLRYTYAPIGVSMTKKKDDREKNKKRKKYSKPKLQKHGKLQLNVADAYY